MISVILVRHADIDPPTPPGKPGPGLNNAGRVRAQALADHLRGAGVSTIFTSEYTRTKQTVEPLAAHTGIVPSEVPEPPSELAKRVTSGALGRVIVIAGHSNTVPDMIGALGVPGPPPDIGHGDFDNMFVVTVAATGNAGLLHLKYGARSV
jgi:phosphohistidine phosphatase SixA